MNDNQLIKELVQQGESEKLEFKSSLNKEAVGKVLASFLNTKGGRLIIGLEENGRIKGIENAKVIANELRHYLINSIVPDSPIDVDIIDINDNQLIVCKVQEGTKQPYIFDGTIYYRVNDRTNKATTAQLSNLISQRQEDELHWERQINLRLDWEDLDEKLIIKTYNEAKTNNRSSYDGGDVGKFLTEYGLMSNMSFTNACGLLFAKNTSKFYPQSRVRLTEYPDSKTSDNLLRDEYLEGNLFSLFDRLHSYSDSLGIRSVFTDDWQRSDFKFPAKALDEGFVNALIHRDYSSFNSQMTVSVYPDRLVIANSGSLPKELGGVGSLKKEHRSFPNNPDIAHLFFLRGYIEKLGRGTNKIVEQCKDAGLNAPKWKNTKSEVVLTFFGPKQDNDGKVDAPRLDSDALTKRQNDALNDAVNDSLKKHVSSKILKRYQELIKLLYTNELLTLKQLTTSLSVSRATMQRDIKLLSSHNFISFRGSDKYREYAINDALKNKIDALKK